MEKFVAVVICVLAGLPAAGAPAAATSRDLLHVASHLSGLPVRRPVPKRMLTGPAYDAALLRAEYHEYPRSLRGVDASLYVRLGLMPSRLQSQRGPKAAASTSRVWYDPAGRRLLLRGAPTPAQARVVNELVRALVDQNFNLRRISGLRVHDRDRALAAEGIVDGIAALASGVGASSVRGTPLEHFLQLESGVGPGKALAKELRYLGGTRAVASALRTFPRTTEQLLHIDKFLEREGAAPVRLPRRIGDWKLSASETFGELDVRSLLRTFGRPNSGETAAGWGGGRLGLYVSPTGQTTAVLALEWDTIDDAIQWRDAVAGYVASAFPGATARDCPPLDHCWSTPSTVASGVLGTASVFAGGADSDILAAALIAQR